MGCTQSGQRSFNDDYVLGPKLATGTFTQTRICTDRRTGEVRAAKIRSQPYLEADCRFEAALLSQLNSASRPLRLSRSQTVSRVLMSRDSGDLHSTRGIEHVLRFFGAYAERTFFCEVFELCQGGELMSLNENDETTEADVARWIRQLLMAIEALHVRGIVHRNVNPGNVLLQETSRKTVKLGGFGLACRVPARALLKDACGSSSYLAPEMLIGNYGRKVDIWAVGVILYVFLFGRLPFVASDTFHLFKSIIEEEPAWTYTPTRDLASRTADCLAFSTENLQGAADPARNAIGAWPEEGDVCREERCSSPARRRFETVPFPGSPAAAFSNSKRVERDTRDSSTDSKVAHGGDSSAWRRGQKGEEKEGQGERTLELNGFPSSAGLSPRGAEAESEETRAQDQGSWGQIDDGDYKPRSDAVDLCKQLLTKNFLNRPTATEALNHPWLQIETWADGKTGRLLPRSLCRRISLCNAEMCVHNGSSLSIAVLDSVEMGFGTAFSLQGLESDLSPMPSQSQTSPSLPSKAPLTPAFGRVQARPRTSEGPTDAGVHAAPGSRFSAARARGSLSMARTAPRRVVSREKDYPSGSPEGSGLHGAAETVGAADGPRPHAAPGDRAGASSGNARVHESGGIAGTGLERRSDSERTRQASARGTGRTSGMSPSETGEKGQGVRSNPVFKRPQRSRRSGSRLEETAYGVYQEDVARLRCS
ncbi:putative Atypical MEK-related kinase (incomplete catalytic triad) [Neospora caninum Liverpool]|uniref:Atypical MEK-related kinase (Incomplete catalytic triad), putative n=1 Tax=Neospora caninum (strain Liverpool) TaxID=572307 RepID=F0VB14_NEOCL|nr:putative Atypical MEK-related kinase (incomplete catalytic triad) [Neospora caninum Liverpool]CBZ50836.1 putative Atypical MEK-related kinase (incomplete catalytic triad) [Neospora caninum Liverpool]CEL68137.1 TPA: Atypical MEK-related kinase (incomplete catalytic triad), putative [Neospora caninum Liverpool]|eukprot:XP_003880869.1 putative Atypical MEK-related kinase (incomplete catalytic triad) [Neospora caninum Liverpool]